MNAWQSHAVMWTVVLVLLHVYNALLNTIRNTIIIILYILLYIPGIYYIMLVNTCVIASFFPLILQPKCILEYSAVICTLVVQDPILMSANF